MNCPDLTRCVRQLASHSGTECFVPISLASERFFFRSKLTSQRLQSMSPAWQRSLCRLSCINRLTKRLLATIHTEVILILTCLKIRLLLAHWIIWNLQSAHSNRLPTSVTVIHELFLPDDFCVWSVHISLQSIAQWLSRENCCMRIACTAGP